MAAAPIEAAPARPVVKNSFQKSFKLELERLKEKGLDRRLAVVDRSTASSIRIGGRNLIDLSSNNYLGLAFHPKVVQAAAEAAREWGAGSRASRLISGNLGIHEALERKLAAFKKEEAALVFSSGYLANLGAVTALVGEGDAVLVDRLNHASLVDAARLSKAKLWVYPHADASVLQKLLRRAASFRRRLVLTDAYFSMDGDLAPLPELLEICRHTDSLLMIDEAHSTGIFGKTGRGATEHFGLAGKVDIVMGTLSKALGSVGGFITGSATLREYFVNRCREFIYTTGPSPSASGAAIAALDVAEKEPELSRRLWKNVGALREALLAADFDSLGSRGPIIPIHIGDTKKAMAFSTTLRKEGFFVPAIRPPTVPKGGDRLRVSLSAAHREEDLLRFARVMKKLRDRL